MKPYTRAGDTGETMSLSGEKIPKNSAILDFIGTADELNAHLGLLRAIIPNERSKRFIEGLQKTLMRLMSHASAPEDARFLINEEDVTALEAEIDALSDGLAFAFAVPGKSELEARIHIGRTVARRAERLFFAAAAKRPLCPHAGAFLNRLSDYLFVLSQRVS